MITEHQSTSPTVPIGSNGWSCCATPPRSIVDPVQLNAANYDWLPTTVPGTAASALRDNGLWDFDRPVEIDAFDWWFRTRFTAPTIDRHPCYLCLDGLATLAEVWLNGRQLLTTDNMFRAYRLDISSDLQASNELVIGFRSLTEDLKQKRPRPRWKTNLVSNQQLRFRRTSLLGHIPGWSPPVPAVGPWRDVRIETQPVSLSEMHLVSKIVGAEGVVRFQARVNSSLSFDLAELSVGLNTGSIELITELDGSMSLRGELLIPDPPRWWPHTHGPQPLFDCQVTLGSCGKRHTIDCGKIGFRQLEIDPAADFAIRINGVPIFCRGACWTTSDIFKLDADEASLRHDLQLARDAGMNMLRVGGTMNYESDAFYQICDELGVLVWQDFMFANMDYPVDDPAFAANIHLEAQQQLRRLASHPSVVVYCGNSEVEQQAAMLGMTRDLWRNKWFAEQLPTLCADLHPGTAYVPSTPSGGVLPFHTRSGVTHYYGIGAYLRSPVELRQADVKFTSECLGFSNVPDPDSINQLFGGALPVTHHPKWKQRVPRDTGAGWDFEDVRDFYLRHLYGLDPVQLRSSDMPRYLQLSRAATGEMMLQTFSEWRSNHSNNRGGLVWFFKDLWQGAGWGVVDAAGTPKSAYYYLKRVFRNKQITLTNEGLNGLDVHLINETANRMSGFVELALLKEPHIVVARHESPIELPARSQKTISVDELIGGFYDVNYAYRFGPPHHDVVVATLYDEDRNTLSEAFHFIRQHQPTITRGEFLDTTARVINNNQVEVTLTSDCFLHDVRLFAKGYLPDDNYFHLPPRARRPSYSPR